MNIAPRFSINPLAMTVALIISAGSTQVLADGTISIEVLDSDTRRAVSDARVIVSPRQGVSTEHQADISGSVTLDSLNAGLYEIEVLREGYFSTRLPSVRVVDDKTTPVSILLSSAKGLEEVRVIGTKNQSQPGSLSSNTLDREALRSAAGGGGDVLRSLDGIPGLFSSGDFSNYTVRGNGPRKNLILVDGIPFANVVHFNDAFGAQEDLEGGGRYSVFAPNVISSAEFQAGGWGPEYGGQAGSLLQLEVAEGNRESASYTARIDVAGLELGYDGPSHVFDNTSVLFSARQYDFSRLFEVIGLDYIGEPSLTDIILKTSSKFENDKVNLLLIHAPEEYQREIKHAVASDVDEIGDFEDVGLVSNKKDNGLYALSWEHLFESGGELNQQIYYRTYDEESKLGEAYPDLVPLGTPDSEIPAKPEILISERTEEELGYRADFAIPNALGRFSSGLRVTQYELDFSLDLQEDWIQYTYTYKDERPSPNQKYVVWTPENTNNQYAQSETNYTLYLDQRFDAGAWEFRGGLRFDRDNFSEENLYAPRIAATWIASPSMEISTTLGRYHQSPSFSERGNSAANAQLENEVIDQISLGIVYSLSENWEVFVEPYYQYLTNLISQPEGSVRELANSGSGRAFGVDTAFTRSFDNGWSANFTYSYNDSIVKDSENEAYYEAEFGRPHSMSIGGIWEINDRWKLSSRWKYASGKPSDTYEFHANVLDEGEPLRYSRETVAFNTGRYGSYSSLNFRVDYRRAFGKTNIIAFLDVINMFGSDNPSNAQFNERSGEQIEEDGAAVPLFGLRFEW